MLVSNDFVCEHKYNICPPDCLDSVFSVFPSMFEQLCKLTINFMPFNPI